MSKMENPKNSFGKCSFFEFVTLLPISLPFSFMVSEAKIVFRNQTDYGHIIVSIKQELFLSNVVRVIITIGNNLLFSKFKICKKTQSQIFHPKTDL